MMQTSERWIGVAAGAGLRQAGYQRIIDASWRAIESRGEFVIVLSGGNTPRGIYTMLRDASTDWSKWRVYFGDERCLPPEDVERNSRMAGDAWLDHMPIPRDRVHAIPAERGAAEGALAYARALRGVGDFDLVLLGLGEDGHTASLFPGHDWGIGAAPDTLAVLDAPKPPPARVSVSAARLSRAREILFLVEGESKRAAVSAWRAGSSIPARAIQPPAGVDVVVESTLINA